ncbi:MAG: hypothetical protein WBM87_00025 [Woeseiaceae bacterium]
MAENSPHGGEMHPDGDEVLYLISGRANVVFLSGTLCHLRSSTSDELVRRRDY